VHQPWGFVIGTYEWEKEHYSWDEKTYVSYSMGKWLNFM
jgi:hypothetical protein